MGVFNRSLSVKLGIFLSALASNIIKLVIRCGLAGQLGKPERRNAERNAERKYAGNKKYAMVNEHAHIVEAHMVIGSLPFSFLFSLQVQAQQPSLFVSLSV